MFANYNNFATYDLQPDLSIQLVNSGNLPNPDGYSTIGDTVAGELDGVVYLGGLALGSTVNSLLLWRLTDYGLTWGNPVHITDYQP